MAGPLNKLDDSALEVIAPVVSALREDLKYMQASNVNVSNFVSVKLSGKSNYHIWKAQMLCLIDSQLLHHIIDAEYNFPEDKGVHMIWQYDKLVKGWIFGSIIEKVLEHFVLLNSAQDVWRKLESYFNPPRSDTEGSPGFIFESLTGRDHPTIDNIDGTTQERLYEATVEGCWLKAKSILENHKNASKVPICRNGNTTLHLAVETGQNYFVEKLLGFLEDGKDIETKNYKGRTALHVAAEVGNKYAAQLLVKKRQKLLAIPDDDLRSPLDSAYNNMKLDTYAYLLESTLPASDSGPFPDDLQQNATIAICAAIFAKQYDLAGTLIYRSPYHAKDKKQILMAITITFPTDLSITESFIYPSINNVSWKRVVRSDLLFRYGVLYTCVDDILQVVKKCHCSRLGKISMILFVPIIVLRFPFSMLYFSMWKVLSVTVVGPIKNLEKKKKAYETAKEILRVMCNQTSSDDFKESILEAVRQDAYEVVDEILSRSPASINCKNEEGHNIIQLAIINRSEKVYNLVHHIIERRESFRKMEDSSMNNLVHLAGRLAPSRVLDGTPGAALQLQRELKWCEEVEKLMLPTELIKENIYGETPAMVFTREHQDLIKQGENWMKTTSESCSITAALIVTVVFAAAITVPGGSNQETGIPLFKNELGFAIFAVSNAFSLFTAATALLLFLSILTARFSERDFLLSLPRRLIFGLVTLFLSTTAMIVAFGAILFLVFCDQRPWMLAPIFGFACLPILVIVTIKLPLLIDLIQSTYFPMFGKKSYLEPCKINKKTTIFTE